MNRIQFIVHIQDDRSSPYLEWRDALPAKDRLKLDATILKISQYGLGVALKMQWAKNWTRTSGKSAPNNPTTSNASASSTG